MIFIHAPNGDFLKSHADTIINYVAWGGANWTAKIEGNKFIHAPNGDFSKSHEDIIINYVTWGGANWTAKIEGNKFIHAPNGDFSKSHKDTIINYVTWGGANWTAKIEDEKFMIFVHAPNGDFSTSHADTIINYVAWGGANWTAKIEGNKFIHAPNGDFEKSHEDTIINYVTWGGTNWTAKIEGNKFIHAPNGDFEKSHEDTIINYVTWGGTNWTANKTPGSPTSRLSTISNGLVAYYPLISDAKDYSGNGYDAVATNGASFGPGLHGGSVTLTGSNASIDLPLNFQRYADHYTISAWVCLNSNEQTTDSQQGTIGGRLGFLRSNGTLIFYFYFDGPNSADNQLIVLQSATGISSNEWHHVAVSYDHDARKLGFYIDRELVSIHDISSQVSRSDRPQFPSYKNIGGTNGSSGTLNGAISDVFLLDITCQKDDINYLGGLMTPQIQVQGFPIKRAAAQIDCSPSWWWVIPLIGQIALHQAANCDAKPVHAPITPSEIVSAIYSFFELSPGSPIPAGKTVTRDQIGVSNSVRIHVDIGGEGPIDFGGVRTGFKDSINLQAADGGTSGDGLKQSQPPYSPIPNLIHMKSWSQAYPFGDKFADYVTIQNAPLTDVNVEQIARIVKPSGEVAFWIGEKDIGEKNGNKTNKDQMEKLAKLLNARIVSNDTDEFNGDAVNPKTSLVLQYNKDEL